MQRLSRGWLVPGALLAAGLAAYPAITQQAAPLIVSLGGLAVALFVAGQALPLPSVLGWSLGLLAIEYLAALQLRSAGLDLTAPAYAAAFFLCAELGWLGLEARRGGGRLWPGRAVAVVSLALAGAALGALVLLLAAVQMAGGALLTGVGVAAAVAVAACLAWLARRQP